jgi:glycosyltransferase involved in cell wall biosynthesis
MTALEEDWTVEVVSWLPDAEQSLAGQWRANPISLLRAMALSSVLPFQVAYFQGFAPSRIRRLPPHDLVLYMTDRAVPRSPTGPYAIDFIDDLGGAASRKAASHGRLLRAFWRWESRRLRRLDARLATNAALSLAVSAQDAAAIGSDVQTIHPSIATRPLADHGTKVVFIGNLFYEPNVEAAHWICDQLAPRLGALSIDPGSIIIAGRRPPGTLRAKAKRAGIDLRPSFPDLAELLSEAAVFICPVELGSGVQTKVIDAVGAGRACVLTPFTNQTLALDDGKSALVRDRNPKAFADAILSLLNDPELRRTLTQNAIRQLQPYTPEVVAEMWRTRFRSQ